MDHRLRKHIAEAATLLALSFSVCICVMPSVMFLVYYDIPYNSYIKSPCIISGCYIGFTETCHRKNECIRSYFSGGTACISEYKNDTNVTMTTNSTMPVPTPTSICSEYKTELSLDCSPYQECCYYKIERRVTPRQDRLIIIGWQVFAYLGILVSSSLMGFGAFFICASCLLCYIRETLVTVKKDIRKINYVQMIEV